MENLIAVGITMMTLIAYFAVPAFMATAAAIAVASFEGRRGYSVQKAPAPSFARLSCAVASVLVVGLLMAPGSFAEDVQVQQIQNGPERQEHILWPAFQYSADGRGAALVTSGPQRRESSLWPAIRHTKTPVLADAKVGTPGGRVREEYSLWPVVRYPKSAPVPGTRLARK